MGGDGGELARKRALQCLWDLFFPAESIHLRRADILAVWSGTDILFLWVFFLQRWLFNWQVLYLYEELMYFGSPDAISQPLL